MSLKKTIKHSSLEQNIPSSKEAIPSSLSEETEHIIPMSVMSSWHSDMKDVIGRYRVTSLFWETRVNEDYTPLFTLKDSPHTVPSRDKKSLVTYPSLKQIYFSYNHVPGYEYDFAMDVFGSWKHWEALLKSTLKDTFQQWRDELAIRLKSSSLKNMLAAAKDPSAVGVNAAKYLADEGYMVKKVGRMTKEEKARQLKIDAGVRDDLSADMDRLGIKVVNGKES